jgi:nickel-dependent lactate racemase
MDFPHMMRIRQTFDDTTIDDIPGDITGQLANLKLESSVKKGQTVAVACSSRGLANYGIIVKAVVSFLKQLKLVPFLIPAMGSHGAATAAGQKRVLEHLGIDEEDVAAPIRSSLEIVQIGETENHIPVYLDRLASEADHIVLINRIKKHTEFEHEFESGLLKMMAIGLGKQEGAATRRRRHLSRGHADVWLPRRNPGRRP